MVGYASFQVLRLEQALGRDYDIRFRPAGPTGILVMALHGGGIEPGTGTLAEAIAGDLHGFYCFRGIGTAGNAALRIPSHLFDEPCAVELACAAESVLSIHGCRGPECCVYLGGRDDALKEAAREALNAASFTVSESARFPGVNPMNLCNRGRSGKGLQLELTAGLRRALLGRKDGGRCRNGEFGRFVKALQDVLTVCSGKPVGGD